MLKILLSSTLISFFALVLIDTVLGVLVAVKKGKFDWNKLPDFLMSQFGTQEAMVVVGLGLSSFVVNAIAPNVIALVLGAMTAGAAAMTASVVSDCVDKAKSLLGRSGA
jgi:hypothetical protein